jgi:hypothetical protein
MMGKFQFLIEGWDHDPQEIPVLTEPEQPVGVMEIPDGMCRQ